MTEQQPDEHIQLVHAITSFWRENYDVGYTKDTPELNQRMRAFQEWLNDYRGHQVSEVFHDISSFYRQALERPCAEVRAWKRGIYTLCHSRQPRGDVITVYRDHGEFGADIDVSWMDRNQGQLNAGNTLDLENVHIAPAANVHALVEAFSAPDFTYTSDNLTP